MPTRLIQLLLLAAALYASGAAVVALSTGNANHARTSAQAVTAPAFPLESASTLLPTVVVRPDPEVPTLATVTVRPDRAGLSGENFVAVPVPATRKAAVVSFAGGGFDMPYYSFGRTLRHVSKE